MFIRVQPRGWHQVSSSTVLSISFESWSLTESLSSNLLGLSGQQVPGIPWSSLLSSGISGVPPCSVLNWCWGDKPQVMVAEQAPCRLNCVPKHRHYKLNNWSLLLSGVTGNEDTALGKQENKYGLYFCPFWDLWGVIVVWMCVCGGGVLEFFKCGHACFLGTVLSALILGGGGCSWRGRRALRPPVLAFSQREWQVGLSLW